MSDNKEYITSYGIVLYSVYQNVTWYVVGLVRDSIAFREFIRGRIDDSEIPRYLKLMSYDEIERIKLYYKYGIKFFDKIWEDLWVNKDTKMYNTCREYACKTFEHNMIKFKDIILSTGYTNKEWIFPKGRKNEKETEKECAIRECSEELNINRNIIKIKNEVKPICERYIGNDGKKYQTKYYLAQINYIPKQTFTYTKNYLRPGYISGEISTLKWGTYDLIMSLLSESKKKILEYFNKQIIVNKQNKIIECFNKYILDKPNKINRPWTV